MSCCNTSFGNTSAGNLLCCVTDCGVPKKLLCVKNGKYVSDPRCCRRVRNCSKCNYRCKCGSCNCGSKCGCRK